MTKPKKPGMIEDAAHGIFRWLWYMPADKPVVPPKRPWYRRLLRLRAKGGE